MRRLFLGLGAVLLIGCESLHRSSTDWLERTSENLRNWGGAEQQAAYDREVEGLFAQPYIDPLTRYLEQYHNDASRADHLQQVLSERDQRCATIARRYEQRPLTEQTLAQYRAGYSYSCPAQVTAFATRLAAKAPVLPAEESVAGNLDAGSAEGSEQPGWDDQLARQLNDCYLLTTIRNFSEARQVCLTPAEQGDLRAQYNMALISRSLEDYDEALNWAHLAAERSASARYLLGELYANGQGVARDDENALRWYLEAAEMGNAAAQYQAGRFLASGRAVAPDPVAAHAWYQRAAGQGDADAQLALGLNYLTGAGVEANPQQGRSWLLRAARQGQAQAQMELARLAEAGGNSVALQAEALIWYELAAGNGLTPAQAEADRLRPRLSPGAVSEAERRVRQMLEGGR